MPVLIAKIWQMLTVLKKHLGEVERKWARFQSRTASNFQLRISLLLLFSVVNVAVGAVIYRWVTAEESTWSDAMFTVYAVLYGIPGSDVTNAPTFWGTVVLNLIFIFGLLVFATILAMITDEVNSVLMNARSGKQPLALSGHILLLNWNHQVSFILDQLEQVVEGHPFAGRPIVILADRNKEEMDGLVVSFLKKHHLEVHTRTGKPYKLEHLERVSAADAHAVLVLHPEGSDSSSADGEDDDSSVSGLGAAVEGDDPGAAALKMQTIMALTAQLLGKKTALVVQVPESSKDGSSQLSVLDQVLHMAGHPTHLLNMPVKRMVNSLAVQTTLQPWSATIYHHILQYGLQPSITFVPLPEELCKATAIQQYSSSGGGGSTAVQSDSYGLGGYGVRAAQKSATTTYEAVRVHFGSELLLLGFIRSKQLVLNPAEGTLLVPGDVLVALSKRADAAAVALSWRELWMLKATNQLAAITARMQELRASNSTKLPTLSLNKASAAKAVDAPAAAVSGVDNVVTNGTMCGDAAAAAGSSSSSSCALDAGEQQQTQAVAGKEHLEPIAEADSGETAAATVDETGTADATVAAAGAAAEHTQETTEDSSALPAAAAPAAAKTVVFDDDKAAAAAALTAGQKCPVPGSEVLAAAAAMAGEAAAAAGAAPNAKEGINSSINAVKDDTAATQNYEEKLQLSAAAPAAAADADAAAAADTLAGFDAAYVNTHSHTKSLAAAHPAAGSAAVHKADKAAAPKSSFADMLRQMCCAAPMTKDVEDEQAAPAGPRPLQRSASGFKGMTQGAAKLGRGMTKGVTKGVTTVTGAVATGVTTGVGAVATGVTAVGGAVMTVAEGAADISKTVVTGAVSTVADGAVSLGKVAAGAVTTVADGAVTLSKGAMNVVTDGAVTLSKGALGAVTTVTGAVTTAVTSTTGLVSGSKGSESNKFDQSLTNSDQPASWAPTSWLFGAGKKQSSAKAAAANRLANVPAAVARGPPSRKLRIVVAGFTAEEAAEDLLPHFVDFAPPGSTVNFTVKEGVELPDGLQWEGSMEEVEEREDGEPITHKIYYKLLPFANPTGREALAAAGLLAADSILLAADESLRGNPSQADAQVLAALVEVQHLLASNKLLKSSQASIATSMASSSSSQSQSQNQAAVFNATSKAFSLKKLASFGSSSSSKKAPAEQAELEEGSSAPEPAAAVPITAAGSAGASAAALSVTDRAASAAKMQLKQAQQWEQRENPPHVVACVATSSSKAVAAAFFGPANSCCAAATAAVVGGGVAAAAAAVEDISAAVDAGSSMGVVGPGLFTYELIVPGEVEGAVLVQVANEPQYVKVVTQLLATSEGCELYLLSPAQFGFSVGEVLGFVEVQEVGRLLRKTAVGVVAGGQVVLLPDGQWRWHVAEQDRIAAIAESW